MQKSAKCTHVKVVAFTNDAKTSKFIIFTTTKVILPIVESEGETAATIPTNFDAEVASNTHGAVEAIPRLGKDCID